MTAADVTLRAGGRHTHARDFQRNWVNSVSSRTRKTVPDTAAGRRFAEFLQTHMLRGTGHIDGVAWTPGTFSAETGISESRISNYRRHGAIPSPVSLMRIERAFFRNGGASAANPAFVQWQEIKAAFGASSEAAAFDPDRARFSSWDAWNMLLRPIRRNVVSIIRDGSTDPAQATLTRSQIRLRLTDRAFIIPVPPRMVRELRAYEADYQTYDIHRGMDLAGSLSLEHFFRAMPIAGLKDIVSRHAHAYAAEVVRLMAARTAYPPYNKPKLGLYGYQQPQRAGMPERAHANLWFYRTDYFTHRVMRRVLHEVRPRYPHLFATDALWLDEPRGHLPYALTSFGLNLAVTAAGTAGRRLYMTRISSRQGNENQRNRMHIAANEGLNIDDVSDGEIDIDAFAMRALAEELGIIRRSDIATIDYIEFGLELRNFEPFISGIVHLTMTDEAFRRMKAMAARDDRRETTEFMDVPFTQQGIFDLLFQNPRGIDDFSSYSLHILDSLLVRNLVPL